MGLKSTESKNEQLFTFSSFPKGEATLMVLYLKGTPSTAGENENGAEVIIIF